MHYLILNEASAVHSYECKNFSKGIECKFGTRCHFRHVQPPPPPPRSTSVSDADSSATETDQTEDICSTLHQGIKSDGKSDIPSDREAAVKDQIMSWFHNALSFDNDVSLLGDIKTEEKNSFVFGDLVWPVVG
jgi:hypothetical protein